MYNLDRASGKPFYVSKSEEDYYEDKASAFATIPTEILHSDLSFMAKILYVFLLQLSHKKGYAFCSDKYISERCLKVSLRTAQRALAELKNARYIKISYASSNKSSRQIKVNVPSYKL